MQAHTRSGDKWGDLSQHRTRARANSSRTRQCGVGGVCSAHLDNASSRSSSLATMRMPRPPPPQSALTITGYPMEWQKAVASASDDTAPLVAGVTGTPKAMALALACRPEKHSRAGVVGKTSVSRLPELRPPTVPHEMGRVACMQWGRRAGPHLDLGPELLQDAGGWAHEHDARLLARSSKVGVLRQEAVPASRAQWNKL